MNDEKSERVVPLWAEARGWDADRIAKELERALRFGIKVMIIASSMSAVIAAAVLGFAVSMRLMPGNASASEPFIVVVLGPVVCIGGILAARRELKSPPPPSPVIDGFGLERASAVMIAVGVIAFQAWASYQIFKQQIGG